MKDIETIIEDEIISGDKNWKDIDKIQNSVKNEYINMTKKNYPDKDAQQSWRSKSGDFLEIFTEKYVERGLKDTNLRIKRDKNIPDKIKNKLKLDFNNKTRLPDIDLVVYDKDPVAIISCKTTPRERISQTLFWKSETESQYSNDIKYYFVTMDKDNELKNGRKWRPILEKVLDCAYFTSDKYNFNEDVKPLPEINEDLKLLDNKNS